MQPITPDAHGIAVLLLTALALFLFTRDNIPLESSSLTILIILTAGFSVFPYAKDGVVEVGPMDFFAGLWTLGASNLGAILFIILFIYGMSKIAKKFE